MASISFRTAATTAVAVAAAAFALAVPSAAQAASTPANAAGPVAHHATVIPNWITCGYYSGSSAVIGRGSRGSAVEEAQCLLDYWGFNAGTVDGIFGTNTYNATRAFQSFCGYTVDGVVGPQTWGGLRNGC